MPTEQTYSLWKGKGGSEFQRVQSVGRGHLNSNFVNQCFFHMDYNPDVYDICIKHDDGTVWVVRRDGAKRGGEE